MPIYSFMNRLILWGPSLHRILSLICARAGKALMPVCQGERAPAQASDTLPSATSVLCQWWADASFDWTGCTQKGFKHLPSFQLPSASGCKPQTEAFLWENYTWFYSWWLYCDLTQPEAFMCQSGLAWSFLIWIWSRGFTLSKLKLTCITKLYVYKLLIDLWTIKITIELDRRDGLNKHPRCHKKCMPKEATPVETVKCVCKRHME